MHTPSLTTKQTLRLHTDSGYYRTHRTVTVSIQLQLCYNIDLTRAGQTLHSMNRTVTVCSTAPLYHDCPQVFTCAAHSTPERCYTVILQLVCIYSAKMRGQWQISANFIQTQTINISQCSSRLSFLVGAKHPPQYYYSDGDRLIIITLVFTKYISSTIRIFRNNLYLHGIMNINLVYSCCSSCCGALSAVRACELQNRDTLQKQQS